MVLAIGDPGPQIPRRRGKVAMADRDAGKIRKRARRMLLKTARECHLKGALHIFATGRILSYKFRCANIGAGMNLNLGLANSGR